jgi:coniferyl-aldehyde dehydrogenase
MTESGRDPEAADADDPTGLRAALALQRKVFRATGTPSAEVRIDRIDRVIDLIVSNADAILAALSEDYGHRSRSQSLLSDIVGPLPGIKHTRKNVRRWMRPTPYGTGALRLLGAKAWVDWQPLGVVGVISPWNFPVGLTFDPVTQAFAAGNSVMVKLSEFVPATSALLQAEIANRFDPGEFCAFTGGPEIGAQFGALPFDHILLTGSPGTGRHVQRAAAENLVPVTLELGGKCPVVVSPHADLGRVADRVKDDERGPALLVSRLCTGSRWARTPARRSALRHRWANVSQDRGQRRLQLHSKQQSLRQAHGFTR